MVYRVEVRGGGVKKTSYPGVSLRVDVSLPCDLRYIYGTKEGKTYGRLAREQMDIPRQASTTISHPNMLLPIPQIVGLLKQKRMKF